MAADIRPARPRDLDALLAIENAAFAADRLSRRSLRRFIADSPSFVMVAEAGGRIAGYGVVLFRAGSPTARLYSIATAREFAGRGIGRALIAATEKEALSRGRHTLRLEVREDNGRAIAIYRQVGFQAAGRVADYYQDGMTAIRMAKCLGAGAALPGAAHPGRKTAAGSGTSSRPMGKSSRHAA